MVKILEITNLSYSKFNNLNISFDSGNFYTIIGPNNSGKTTLFNALTGLHNHTGNWPGKTVSNSEGTLKIKNKT